MAYFDDVSMKYMKYRLPCIEVGSIGPQTSDNIAIPISYLCALAGWGCGRLFPLAHPKHENLGGGCLSMDGSGGKF